MSGKNIIEINGRAYDAITGLPVVSTAPEAVQPVVTKPTVTRAPVAAAKPHQTQKSMALRRDAVAKPRGPHAQVVARTVRQPAIVPQSAAVSKFATHPSLASAKPVMSDISPVRRPVAPQLRAARNDVVVAPLAGQAVPQTHLPQPSVAHVAAVPHKPAGSHAKESVLARAVEASVAHHAQPHHAPRRRLFPKIATIMTVTATVAVFAGYLTYLTMPGLSMKIAANQAGLAATYPEFQPSGYGFDGPISFASGEVTARFASHADDSYYAIKQRKSNWDSQAVLNNYVTKQSARYVTLTENGITVYTFDGKAAWVNGGILYTLNGNAMLSNDQVMKIATSM